MFRVMLAVAFVAAFAACSTNSSSPAPQVTIESVQDVYNLYKGFETAQARYKQEPSLVHKQNLAEAASDLALAFNQDQARGEDRFDANRTISYLQFVQNEELKHRIVRSDLDQAHQDQLLRVDSVIYQQRLRERNSTPQCAASSSYVQPGGTPIVNPTTYDCSN